MNASSQLIAGPYKSRRVICPLSGGSLAVAVRARETVVMFGDGFEQATILRTGPDGLTRVIVRSSWAGRESLLVDAREAELVVFRRWQEFHREALGFTLSWRTWTC